MECQFYGVSNRIFTWILGKKTFFVFSPVVHGRILTTVGILVYYRVSSTRGSRVLTHEPREASVHGKPIIGAQVFNNK